MSEAGDKALDEVEKMMGMGTIPPDVRESLKEEAVGAVDVDNNDFVNEFLSQLASDTGTVENTAIPVESPRSRGRSRFEKIREQEEERADLDYIMSGQAALDQAFEDAVARDDYHEERFGLPGSSRSTAIVEGPETVIQPANEPKGFLDAFSQEVKDFDHNIPWGERVDLSLIHI